jgi:hypothetical protein
MFVVPLFDRQFASRSRGIKNHKQTNRSRSLPLFSFRTCDCEVRGHCMCKEMPAIPVHRVVDPKRIIGKMECQGVAEVQGVADPPKN